MADNGVGRAESRVNPTDILAVRSRVSWASIAAGAMVALAVYFVLTMLGTAVGLEVAIRRRNVDLDAAASVYSLVVLLLAMFFGGWATSRLSVGESKLEAVLYGVILWGVLFVGMFWLIGSGLRVGFGALLGLASGAVDLVVVGDDESAGAAPNSSDRLPQRYRDDLGGDSLVNDLKKHGLDEKDARKAQEAVKDHLDRLASPSQPAATDQPAPKAEPTPSGDANAEAETLRSLRQAENATRRATWFALAGVIISLGTVVLGSLIGSGDLPVPVPILGVRPASRPVATRPAPPPPPPSGPEPGP